MAEVTVFVCPRCQQRCVRAMYSGDFEHACFGSDTLANEDVLVLGNWTDFTGSDNNVHGALQQGRENTLDGTRAALEGEKDYPRTVRGFRKPNFRTRQHIEHIDAKEFKNQGIPDRDIISSEK